MSLKSRILALITVLILTALCPPLFGADDGDAPATDPPHVAGFFETHFVLTELIVLPILALAAAGAMASNTTTERIKTTHWDFWGKPLGSSFTSVTVPKEPSSPDTIKKTLLILGVIYLIARFTCLFAFLNVVYQCIGDLIDTFFSLMVTGHHQLDIIVINHSRVPDSGAPICPKKLPHRPCPQR